MNFKVLDFYRKVDDTNPFVAVLKDPTFYILVNKDGKSRELVLDMKGEFPYISYPDVDCFENEAYNNYKIITNFLLGEHRENIQFRWGFNNKEYRDFIFELYKILVNSHSYYSWFKKKLLLLLGYLKFNSGKVEV